MVLNSTLPSALFQKMQQENLNQSQLAQKLEIPIPLLSMILSGKRGASLEVSKRIYRLYPDLAEVLLT